MQDVIGKKLSEAIEIVKSEGYEVRIIENISDKQKEWDCMLVVRQKESGNIVELTISNFRMEI